MNYKNKINSFLAEKTVQERRALKEQVMNELDLKTDAAFYRQRNGVATLSIGQALVWAKYLKEPVEKIFLLISREKTNT
jgi:hypothetical protein